MSPATERLIAIIAPVFIVILIGWLMAGSSREDRPHLADVNKLNMDLFCPALIFMALSAKDFDVVAAAPLALGSLVVVIGSGLLAWAVARAALVDARTFVPSMMFNNCGNMGLPLAYLTFGEQGLAMMVVLFVTSNFLMFTFGMRFVRGDMNWTEAILNPMVLATIAGTICGVLKVTFPAWLVPALKMLGDVSIPLMLFSLGVRMRDLSFRDWHLPVLGAIVCPVSGLIIAPFLGRPLGLTDMQADVLLLFASLPPAVLNFLLAERYQREPQQVASIVLIGNLASIVFVPLALAWALHR
jgi:hypothetical protein